MSGKVGTNMGVSKRVCLSLLEQNLKKAFPSGSNDSGIQKISFLSLTSLQCPPLNGSYLIMRLLKKKTTKHVHHTQMIKPWF